MIFSIFFYVIPTRSFHMSVQSIFPCSKTLVTNNQPTPMRPRAACQAATAATKTLTSNQQSPRPSVLVEYKAYGHTGDLDSLVLVPAHLNLNSRSLDSEPQSCRSWSKFEIKSIL